MNSFIPDKRKRLTQKKQAGKIQLVLSSHYKMLTIRSYTVSYTHLDVYKRQLHEEIVDHPQLFELPVADPLDGKPRGHRLDAHAPVSYTHLARWRR